MTEGFQSWMDGWMGKRPSRMFLDVHGIVITSTVDRLELEERGEIMVEPSPSKGSLCHAMPFPFQRTKDWQA